MQSLVALLHFGLFRIQEHPPDDGLLLGLRLLQITFDDSEPRLDLMSQFVTPILLESSVCVLSRVVDEV